MGLYGNVIVEPADLRHRRTARIALTLDDILIEDGKVAPLAAPRPRHSQQ